MHGKNILFFDPDARTCRIAERALRATGSEVTTLNSSDEAYRYLEDSSPALVMMCGDPDVVDLDELTRRFDVVRERSPKSRFVLHVTSSTESYLPILRSRSYIRNLIAKNSDPLEPDELIVTAEKLLRADLFGLDKYLQWGVEPLAVKVREASKKPDYIAEVSEYADSLGCGSRTIDMIVGIVDELVTNAIFNAPVGKDGKAVYRERHRAEPIVLSQDEAATLQFACDGNYIALSLRDPFGSLTQDTVISYLNRCLVKGPGQISEGAGGAGIGLYRVFQSLSKFIINLEPGVRTEVIALIDLRLSMRQFRQAAKSLHFFLQE